MNADFTSLKAIKNVSPEEIESALKEALDRLLRPKRMYTLELYRAYILRECDRLKEPFERLIGYYLSSKEQENFDQIVKSFLTYYENFTAGFRELISYNHYHKYTSCLIAVAWLEVLEVLEKQAQSDGDFLARSIFMQLQTDIIFTTEELYEE